jgi:hypothetical protein
MLSRVFVARVASHHRNARLWIPNGFALDLAPAPPPKATFSAPPLGIAFTALE